MAANHHGMQVNRTDMTGGAKEAGLPTGCIRLLEEIKTSG
jgi:hypothetical protein